MKCARLECTADAVDDSNFCGEHRPSALILPVSRTEATNVAEAKQLRQKIEAALRAAAEELDAARAAGFVVSFNIEPDRAGKHRVNNLAIARFY